MDKKHNNHHHLQKVINAIRVRHYSRCTEETSLHLIKRHIYFHHKRHPKEMAECQVSDLFRLMGWIINLA
ncbi:MAG: phage integrase N-terminal SAM-like domain-containing protein [Candidatus Thiodiazotropha sp. (ex Lucinoma kastoroae)]|nr:phage integrase N-terminal SAM-like domain-containing protein [Candidatus Thiodiazotropha sp. (ex Lucinoma kastoroae)]